MVVEAQRLPFESLARLTERLAAGVPVGEALELIAEIAVDVLPVELAVVRVLDEADGSLAVRAIAPPTSPLAAQVVGSRLEPGVDPGRDRLLVPARAGDRIVGALELVGELDGSALVVAELVAAQL